MKSNFDLGVEGYNSGLVAAAQCPEWMKRCEGLQVGQDSGVKEWNAGWYAARLENDKKLFPELYR